MTAHLIRVKSTFKWNTVRMIWGTMISYDCDLFSRQYRYTRLYLFYTFNQGSHRPDKIFVHDFSLTISWFSMTIFFTHLAIATFCRKCGLSRSLPNFLVETEKNTNLAQFGVKSGKIPWLIPKSHDFWPIFHVPWLLANFSCSMTFPWPFSFSRFSSLRGNPV